VKPWYAIASHGSPRLAPPVTASNWLRGAPVSFVIKRGTSMKARLALPSCS
jgi:hypothetical protein